MLDTIKRSLDYRYRDHDFKLGIALTAIAFAFLGLPAVIIIPYQPFAAILIMLLPVIMMIPAWAIGLSKKRKMCKNTDKYVIYDAVLKNPHPKRHFTYFEAHLSDGRTVDTEAIFNNSQLSERCYDDWNNKRVTVAYDEENGRLVVIAKKTR